MISDNVEFFFVLWWSFWKWWSVEIFQCRESIQDIFIYQHIKYWWYRKMLNFYRPFFMPCFLLLLLFSFVSVDHELVHGRSQELLDRISWNLVELYIYVSSFVVKGVKVIFWGVQSHILRGSKGIWVTIESYGNVEISYIKGKRRKQ
jgi:hypothetical protein